MGRDDRGGPVPCKAFERKKRIQEGGVPGTPPLIILGHYYKIALQISYYIISYYIIANYLHQLFVDKY